MAVPTSVNATSVAAMIKELYPQRRIDRMWELHYPLLAEIKKSDRFDGRSYHHPIETGHPAVSGDFAKAQANYFATQSKSFEVTSVDLYGVARIVSKTMRQARNNSGAFVRVLDREIENLLKAMRKRAALALYRDQGGSLGQVAAIDTATYTLTNKTDVANFSLGALVFLADESDGGTPRNSSQDEEIVAIDFTAGTITLAAAISGDEVGDYFFIVGDDSTANTGAPAGLESWITPSTPGDLFGVVRTATPEVLSGHKITDTSLTIHEAIQEAAYAISFTGGAPNRAYLNPMQMKNLANELNTQVVRDPGGTGKFGFSGFNVQTAVSTITVLGDPACPETRCFVGDLDSLELVHLDAFPHLVEDDSLKMLRVSNADSVEVRARAWYNMVCDAPGHWANITLGAAR